MVTASSAAIGGCGKFTRNPRPFSEISGLEVGGREVLSGNDEEGIGARESSSAGPVTVPCHDSIRAVILLDSVLSPRGVRSHP